MELRREFIEGFRITRIDDGLIIEAIDYHARPLHLTRRDLVDLGIRLIGPREPRGARGPRGVAGERAGTRDREV